MDKKPYPFVTNILPILAHFILMVSAAAWVIEFPHVLKLFIIAICNEIKGNKICGNMKCGGRFAAMR